MHDFSKLVEIFDAHSASFAEGAVLTGNIKGTAEHHPTIQYEHQHGKINPKYKNRMFSAKRAFCAMDGRQKAASQLCLSKFRHPVNLDASDIPFGATCHCATPLHHKLPVLEFEREISGERVRDKKLAMTKKAEGARPLAG